MLIAKTMSLVASGNCDNLDLFNVGNGQTIREKLLRQAVKSCDAYATDILILLDNPMKRLFDGDTNEIDIYFQQMSISWRCSDNECDKVPKYYRYAMKIVKNGDCIKLYEQMGNS